MDYKEFRERYQYDAAKDMLGQGGFGRVFKARDVLLDRWVALKVFSRSVPDQYDLISEIRRAIILNHPNICRYYGAEVLKGADALGDAQVIQVGIMDFVESGTIDDFLRKNPKHRKKLLGDVLRGLSYLHRHRPPIIHRDLKPPNVLVSIEDGVPVAKITDFGISKTSRESGIRLSRRIGTLEYMAPEQLNPARYGVNGNIQCNLDLWSFGVMTMELVTGKLPFGAGDPKASTGQIQEAIIGGVSERELNGFEEPYRSVLRKCMVPDAGKRVQSADELLPLLEGKGHEPTRRETVVIPPAPRPDPVIRKPKPSPKGSYKWIWGIALVLAIAAVILPLLLIPRTQQSTESASPLDSGSNSNPANTPPADTGPPSPPVDIAKQANDLYLHGHYAAAAPLLTKACDGGNMAACDDLGELYFGGHGVTKDYAQTRALYQKACDGGNMKGCADLAFLYRGYGGVIEDDGQARDLYQKACDGGYMAGCIGIGAGYEYGAFGVTQDFALAVAMYRKACDGGDMYGCNDLGSLYQKGEGVTQDNAQARAMYLKACHGGVQEACVNLKNLP